MKMRFGMLTALLVAAAALFAQTADIKIFATSDVHNNYLPYDYFTDTANEIRAIGPEVVIA